MPKISIIMPVHNEPENILRTAINSMIRQTYEDFEFIIINDASQNNAEEVILSYKDKRIKYFKNEENLKVIKTLNKGLDLATGEYIARMDADDISFRTRLQKQVEILDNNFDIGLVSSQCYLHPTKRLVIPPINHNDIEKVLKYSVNCIIHPVVLFRRSVIESNKLKYSETHLHIEDYKLWIDMSNVTKLYSIPEPLLLHRDWNESVSRQNIWEQYYNAKNLVFESILKDVNADSEHLRQVFNEYLHGNKISQKDSIEIDKVLCEAIKKAYKDMSTDWFNYILKVINELRSNIEKQALQ
ncbi:glycosyltransferase family 2 protein [bacterium]|nr:glycosyltransferase family 2 protein [bacterium]